MKYGRELPTRRPIPVRVLDWQEVYEDFPPEKVRKQGARCMDCGIPFCHTGCPLGNLIPEWNDLVYRDDWKAASDRLHATNNFPEFTGRLCPAPCEAACVLGINEPPVTIKQIEVEIIDRAWEEGWVEPVIAQTKTGKRVAVVGSGPSGLAAAQQLTRRPRRDGLRTRRSHRRPAALRHSRVQDGEAAHRAAMAQMAEEGTQFRVDANVGVNVPVGELSDCDAVVLAGGATAWRDLPVPGRELTGIYQAMEYLPPSNRVREGDLDESPISAQGKHVVIIGGGDTGADCLGTAIRQGAATIHQFEILPRPPDARVESMPWPTYPMIYRVSSAHEEGGERVYAVNTECFLGDDAGNVRALRARGRAEDRRRAHDVREGRGHRLRAPVRARAARDGIRRAAAGGPARAARRRAQRAGQRRADARFRTNLDNVFVAGDMGRGQSLIVWAIAEGRARGRGRRVPHGRDPAPAPITPDAVPMR